MRKREKRGDRIKNRKTEGKRMRKNVQRGVILESLEKKKQRITEKIAEKKI